MIFIHEIEESLLLASLGGFVKGLFWDIWVRQESACLSFYKFLNYGFWSVNSRSMRADVC